MTGVGLLLAGRLRQEISQAMRATGWRGGRRCRASGPGEAGRAFRRGWPAGDRDAPIGQVQVVQGECADGLPADGMDGGRGDDQPRPGRVMTPTDTRVAFSYGNSTCVPVR
jgi:hypothetical protein